MAHDLFFKKTSPKNFSRLSGADFVGLVSSSSARIAADQLRADIDNLNDTITSWYKSVAIKRDPKHGIFVNAWIRFRDVTYKSIEDSKRTFNPELASSILARLNIMQGTLKGWARYYERVSKETYGVLSTDLVKAPEPPKEKSTSPWMYAAVGLGSVVVVGGVLGYFLIPKLMVGGALGGVLGKVS